MYLKCVCKLFISNFFFFFFSVKLVSFVFLSPSLYNCLKKTTTTFCPCVSWSALFDVTDKVVWVNIGCVTHCVDVAAHRDSSAPEHSFSLCKIPHQSVWLGLSVYTINTLAHATAKQLFIYCEPKIALKHNERHLILLVICCTTQNK